MLPSIIRQSGLRDMKRQRSLVVYLAFPIVLAFFNGIRGTIWLPDLGAPKTILMFALCGIPTWNVAALCSHGLLAVARLVRLPALAALACGALVSVIFSYYAVVVFANVAGDLFPGLDRVLQEDGRNLVGGLWQYLRGPTGLTFLPLWAGAQYLYEVLSGDVLFFKGVIGERANGGEPAVDRPTVSATGFLQKLRPELGKSLLAIEAQEHYVKVYTERGDDLILYRFGDAVNELAARGGLQVHRSYWVSQEAVTAVRPVGKSYRLTLRNGLEVPVSQSYRGALKEHGLLKGHSAVIASPLSRPVELSRAS